MARYSILRRYLLRASDYQRPTEQKRIATRYLHGKIRYQEKAHSANLIGSKRAVAAQTIFLEASKGAGSYIDAPAIAGVGGCSSTTMCDNGIVLQTSLTAVDIGHHPILRPAR